MHVCTNNACPTNARQKKTTPAMQRATHAKADMRTYIHIICTLYCVYHHHWRRSQYEYNLYIHISILSYVAHVAFWRAQCSVQKPQPNPRCSEMLCYAVRMLHSQAQKQRTDAITWRARETCRAKLSKEVWSASCGPTRFCTQCVMRSSYGMRYILLYKRAWYSTYLYLYILTYVFATYFICVEDNVRIFFWFIFPRIFANLYASQALLLYFSVGNVLCGAVFMTLCKGRRINCTLLKSTRRISKNADYRNDTIANCWRSVQF